MLSVLQPVFQPVVKHELVRTPVRTVDPFDFAPSLPPDGYLWGFVYLGNQRVTLDGEPVVALVEI